MIPLKFFRDKTHVYVNNPKGITKKMTIADFEEMMSGGGSDLPEYSPSNQGEVLSVDSDGDLAWVSLQQGASVLIVNELYNETDDYTYLDKSFSEIVNGAKDGVVAIVSYYEEDDAIAASSYYVAYAGLAMDGISNIVIAIGAVEMDVGNSGVIMTYKEDNDILKYDHVSYSPPPATEFTINSGALAVSPSAVFPLIGSGINCYFGDLTAGTGNERKYTIVEYGNTGTTYYIKLSNGNTYTGLWDANTMTLVSNP